MKKQLDALGGMLIKPRQTILDLPTNHFYFLSFLIYAYFNISRLYRKGHIYLLADVVGSTTIALIVSLAMLPIFFVLGSYLIKIVIRLFKREISVTKVMNIAGYAQVPRFVFSLIISFVIYVRYQNTKSDVFLQKPDLMMIILYIIGFALLLFTAYLSIWGVDKIIH